MGGGVVFNFFSLAFLGIGEGIWIFFLFSSPFIFFLLVLFFNPDLHFFTMQTCEQVLALVLSHEEGGS